MIRFYSEFLFYDLGSGLVKLFGNSCFHSKNTKFSPEKVKVRQWMEWTAQDGIF